MRLLTFYKMYPYIFEQFDVVRRLMDRLHGLTNIRDAVLRYKAALRHDRQSIRTPASIGRPRLERYNGSAQFTVPELAIDITTTTASSIPVCSDSAAAEYGKSLARPAATDKLQRKRCSA